MWRSLVARVVRDDEAAGSNPVTPTGGSSSTQLLHACCTPRDTVRHDRDQEGSGTSTLPPVTRSTAKTSNCARFSGDEHPTGSSYLVLLRTLQQWVVAGSLATTSRRGGGSDCLSTDTNCVKGEGLWFPSGGSESTMSEFW